VLEAWEGQECTKQMRRTLWETLKQDFKNNLNILQLQKHICMVDIFIQNILQKGRGERQKAKGDP
jgi:hypothetical protein